MRLSSLLMFVFLAFMTNANAQIVINEIMYNPPESGTDSLEYIELYNAGNMPVSLNNWTLACVAHTFGNISIAGGGYLVVASNEAAIESIFGIAGVVQWVNGSGIALNNGGEAVVLKNAAGLTIDSVSYDDNTPWPIGASGNGSSLELCNASLDNTLATSWTASTNSSGVTVNSQIVKGSPGEANASICGAEPVVVSANNDSYTMAVGQTGSIDVLNNDVIVTPPATVLLLNTTTTLGTLSVVGNIINVVSNGECGSTTFQYIVADGSGADTAQVTLNVTCPDSYPIYGIAQVTGEDVTTGVADSLGVTCQLSGVVHGVNLRNPGLQFYIIDETNDGIGVFSNTQNYSYTVAEGDLVTIFGTIDQFNGLTQILADTVIVQSSGNALQTPTTVSTLGEFTESQFVQLNCIVLDPTDWDTVGNATGFSLTTSGGYTIRIDNNVAMFQPTVPFNAGTSVNIRGIGSQFDNTTPYTGGYQLIPMVPSDISICSNTVDAATIGFSVQPNPAQDRVQVNLPQGTQVVRVFSNTGAKMIIMNTQQTTEWLETAQWPAGVYHLQIEGSFGASYLRLVKQ